MASRGTAPVPDRLFSSLPYLLPLIEAVAVAITLPGLNNSIFVQIPIFQFLLVPLGPVMSLYLGIPFLPLILFMVLFFFVVRNDRVSHFIRFNTMQAILLDIVIVVARLVSDVIFKPLGPFVLQTLANTIFLGILIAVIYSVFQSLMGRYAEIPTLSEAVHLQVR
jgi:uncharacterized membrane protein